MTERMNPPARHTGRTLGGGAKKATPPPPTPAAELTPRAVRRRTGRPAQVFAVPGSRVVLLPGRSQRVSRRVSCSAVSSTRPAWGSYPNMRVGQLRYSDFDGYWN